jgi:hypothetical protein
MKGNAATIRRVHNWSERNYRQDCDVSFFVADRIFSKTQLKKPQNYNSSSTYGQKKKRNAWWKRRHLDLP